MDIFLGYLKTMQESMFDFIQNHFFIKSVQMIQFQFDLYIIYIFWS